MDIVIIDDEQFALSYLKKIVMESQEVERVTTFSDALEGLSYLISNSADLVFLDIEMPKLNGLYIAEQLKKIHPNIRICFVTGYSEHAVEAFELQAIDYIVKPYNRTRVKEVLISLNAAVDEVKGLDNLVDHLPQPLDIICVLEEETIKFINIEDLIFIEYKDRQSVLVTDDAIFKSNKSLSYYEKRMDDGKFFRCHKCFLINLEKIGSIIPKENYTYDVVIESMEALIPLSRSKYKLLKQKLKV